MTRSTLTCCVGRKSPLWRVRSDFSGPEARGDCRNSWIAGCSPAFGLSWPPCSDRHAAGGVRRRSGDILITLHGRESTGISQCFCNIVDREQIDRVTQHVCGRHGRKCECASSPDLGILSQVHKFARDAGPQPDFTAPPCRPHMSPAGRIQRCWLDNGFTLPRQFMALLDGIPDSSRIVSLSSGFSKLSMLDPLISPKPKSLHNFVT